ncbi:MAG: leucine-rich repeat domain-containing protein [Ruminococcus sp.]|nr:leucine-rich repeat domain-containing protein [Ruminococcus sp.]
MGCSSLTSIKIPDSVTTIGEGAFYDTPLFELKKKENPLVIINGILIDGEDCSGDVIIPDGVKIIGNDAFLGCIGLTSVTIPDSVISIGAGAFSDCVDLISVDIPNSVTSIGDGAFRACENLIFIKIPNSVISIGDEVFAGCEKLPTTEIPDSVTSIGKFIFSGVGDLEEIKILNPECILPEFIINVEEGEGMIFDITIYGYDNSTAQTYAKKYGYKFKSLGESPIK